MKELIIEERDFRFSSSFHGSGYDPMHALLRHPDLYNVDVLSAGIHDQRLDKAWWSKLWIGYPVDNQYRERLNLAFTDRLEVELLLVHGELDDNLHPAATLALQTS